MIEDVPLPADTAELLAKKLGTTIDQAKAILRAQAELAWEQVSAGKYFVVPGVGTLIMVERSERKGVVPYGPNAGSELIIPAKRVVKFRVSKLARTMILESTPPPPDLFDPGPIASFKFSVEAKKLSDGSPFLDGLGDRLTLRLGGPAASLSVYQLPDLQIPSGRTVACDIYCGGRPFARKVPPGHYSLGLVAANEEGGRIAFAILRFSTSPVVRWEIATFEGQDAGALKPDKMPGYGVDSGTGSFSVPPHWRWRCRRTNRMSGSRISHPS